VAPNHADREAFAVGSFAFGFLALVLAFAALVTAAHATSRSDHANKRITELGKSGVVSNTSTITLQEFSVTAQPGLVKAGKVTVAVKNGGSIIHELVIVRAASPQALPTVTKAGGERSVGAVDEEALAEVNLMGEAGDVPPGKTVTKTFALPAGTYVLFCNIDNKSGGTTVNHFKKGMATTLVVV
jgi:hypothetical protein